MPLAAVSGTASILAAMAQVMGFSFYQGKETPEQQLNGYLRRKEMLLVLDNYEHLIDEERLHWLTGMLAAAPGIRMMITSRARLIMRGEYLVPWAAWSFQSRTRSAGGSAPWNLRRRTAAFSSFCNAPAG